MNLTKDEAFNALTNNLKGYEWERDITKKPEEFFNSLHDEILDIYKVSNVVKADKKWGFSISSTPLEKHKPVLVGLNWGAGKNWIEQERQQYPNENFNNLKDLGSFGRVKEYLNEFLAEKSDVVQVNYCFFRSQNDKQIFADLNTCQGQFLRLIRYLEPTKLLVFSSLVHYELNPFLTDLQEHRDTFKRGKSDITFRFYMGIINVYGFDINYYSLPHPNSKIPGEVRRRAWEFCFGSNLK